MGSQDTAHKNVSSRAGKLENSCINDSAHIIVPQIKKETWGLFKFSLEVVISREISGKYICSLERTSQRFFSLQAKVLKKYEISFYKLNKYVIYRPQGASPNLTSICRNKNN